MRFLVMGSGGIGGIVAAHLVETSHDVAVVSKNVAIADAVNARGFQLRGDGGARTVPGRVHPTVGEAHDAAGGAPFDAVMLATQPTHVEEAARAALPALGPDGRMVCMQNGLCESRVAAIAGDERTVGAIVAWGAASPEPGVFDRTAAGGFTLGALDGRDDARIAELARALECIGPVELTRNLRGKRWSKLAINCAITSLGTLAGARLGALLQHRHARRLALEIMTEAVQVARAEAVTLEKVSGTIDLEWLALTEEEHAREGGGVGTPGLVAKHAMLLAVGLRYRRMRSSMAASIERGRPPAVDFLNGEVVDRGRARGIPTPVNARVRDMVWRLAQGKEAAGMPLLRAVYEATGTRAG
jgi:2-dehydropantoate 2-reductase